MAKSFFEIAFPRRGVAACHQLSRRVRLSLSRTQRKASGIQGTRSVALRTSPKANIYSVTIKGTKTTKTFKNLGIFFAYFVIFVVQLLIPHIKDLLG